MKQKEKKIQGSKQEDSEGSEEIKEELDRYSVWGDQNLTKQNQQQESIQAGKGSNLRETG